MERAAIDAAILQRFPEFGRFRHELLFVSERQNLLLPARLARNAMRLDNGCIVWDANCNNDGYGRLTLRMHGVAHVFYVHRVVWQLIHGRDIPHFREIAHRCDWPPCFNPEHLVLQRRPDNRKASADNTNRKKLREQMIVRFRAEYGDALVRIAA